MTIQELLAKDKVLMQAWDMLADGLSPKGVELLNSALLISYSLGGLDVCRGWQAQEAKNLTPSFRDSRDFRNSR